MLRSAFLIEEDVITKIDGTSAGYLTGEPSSLDINNCKENLENDTCS